VAGVYVLIHPKGGLTSGRRHREHLAEPEDLPENRHHGAERRAASTRAARGMPLRSRTSAAPATPLGGQGPPPRRRAGAPSGGPGLMIDGEMQPDTAGRAGRSSPNLSLQHAEAAPHVLVFPNLEAGNIAQQNYCNPAFGDFRVDRPLLTGLSKPGPRGSKARQRKGMTIVYVAAVAVGGTPRRSAGPIAR